jgi:hypothetical protein
MTHTSIATFWTLFLPTALAVIAAIGTWATSTLAGKLKFDKGSQALDDFDQAMAHGVALLEDTLQGFAAHNSTVSIPNTLSGAVQLVLSLAPAVESALGITPESIAQLLVAKLSPPAAAVVAAHVAANGPTVPGK